MLQLLRVYAYRIIRLAGNIRLDLKYGGFLGGSTDSRYKALGAYSTVNSDYSLLSLMFSKCAIKNFDVLVDVGCGRGRVINWWLNQGIKNKIVGIELDKEIASKTRYRLKKYKNVSIITGNAIKDIPEDGTIFYLYNPFNEPVMEKFKVRLEYLFAERGGITIIYYNCVHINVFTDDPQWMVKEYDTGLDGFAIIKLQNGTDDMGRKL